MNRRTFLKAAAAVPMVAAVPAIAAPIVETFVNPAVAASVIPATCTGYPVFFNNRIWFISSSSAVSYSTTLEYLEV